MKSNLSTGIALIIGSSSLLIESEILFINVRKGMLICLGRSKLEVLNQNGGEMIQVGSACFLVQR